MRDKHKDNHILQLSSEHSRKDNNILQLSHEHQKKGKERYIHSGHSASQTADEYSKEGKENNILQLAYEYSNKGNKGFFASAILLSAMFLISQELAVYALFQSQAQETRNVLLLQQRINEKIYSIENGFRFAVHDALSSTTGDERADAAIICAKLAEWAKKSETEGISSSIEFVGEPGAMQLGFENCPFFMGVQNRAATVGYSGLNKIAPWDFGALSFDNVAFVFRTKEHAMEIKVFVPAGTVIT